MTTDSFEFIETESISTDGETKTLTVTDSTISGNMALDEDTSSDGGYDDILTGRDSNDVLIGNQGNDFFEPEENTASTELTDTSEYDAGGSGAMFADSWRENQYESEDMLIA